ncbi:tRNA (adenosine(37)-N6)-threonylcarbamoyltransferase complex dimerization subunit type 1 TsaB [Acidocella aminolytica]|uniref:Peptidase n=1 Tax=Acidocella aminolytica 101 = DSM 11237 TaxID=1120923 RepID=A0A0D6PE22_9PROT|nr:tRNA (adenosine(37)-N6)-threonylcarbamoyltransferase complex dimerization subunit type 1 TsaB [Acidocella aminolytica]GAN80015.1 peptidase [Acidocella aminolytica 101 = DSM 11237]GBQ40544.1 metal-dependent protease [Acidocella aminolytica 101 = DSM 11237]SHF08652.1 tRNA threonylcarbamoyl adenosine modification protein YeaZ [Acidocella aminolytica 101 = DSM 11237]
MSLIALDASGPRAGLVLMDQDGAVRQRWSAPLKPGLIETLPLLLQEAAAGREISDIAVCVGPGSFTGLRTSIALAQGFAAGCQAVLWGISAAAAYGQALPGLARPLWVAIRARRGRLFLLREDEAVAFADADVPLPQSPVAIAGDQAQWLAAMLAAKGANVMLTDARLVDAAWVGRAALAQKRAGQAPGAALPLYVDPPEAKLPAAGLRPAPV